VALFFMHLPETVKAGLLQTKRDQLQKNTEFFICLLITVSPEVQSINDANFVTTILHLIFKKSHS